MHAYQGVGADVGSARVRARRSDPAPLRSQPLVMHIHSDLDVDVSIKYLADCPDTVPLLAQWLFDEWGYRSPDGTVQGMADNLHQRLNRNRLPMALVALGQGEPLGTASLKAREVEIRPDYENWLATVYVDKPYRGGGVGSMLIEAASEEAAKLGIDELYLYTRRNETEALYARLGWVPVERLIYRGRPAVIMKRTLAG